MKLVSIIVVSTIALFLSFAALMGGWSVAGSLVSASNDGLVALGLILYGLVIGGYISIVVLVVRSIVRASRNRNAETCWRPISKNQDKTRE